MTAAVLRGEISVPGAGAGGGGAAFILWVDRTLVPWSPERAKDFWKSHSKNNPSTLIPVIFSEEDVHQLFNIRVW